MSAELLEQRMLPAVITVTSLADTVANDGQVTLREAIQAANSDATVDGVTGSGADTIQFAPALTASGPATITLGGTQLAITSNLTIKGSGAEKLTIDGGNLSRIFKVDDGTSAKVNVQISGLTMAKGKAVEENSRGGAILNRETLNLLSTTIRESSGSSGGSAIRSEQADLIVSQSTFHGNTGGRGTISTFQGTLTITQSTISGNSTNTYGGGLDLILTTTVVEQCTIVGNTADWKGGGILNDASNLTVVQSTIANNHAQDGGGGIYTFSGSHLTLHNTILINNTTVGGQANDLGVYSGQLASARSNLIGDPLSAGGLTHGVNGNIIGADNGSGGRVRLNAASVLATTLAANGGPTKTLALVSGSPAINAGDNSLIPADVRDLDGDGNLTEAVPFDQRGSGFGRIASGLVDIGASEFGAVALQMFDLAPGVTSSYPERFQNIDGTLLFNAKDGPGKSKLWLTDGTTAGTMLAPELRPGIKGPTHDNFATLNGISYFAASDSEFGVELWKTDGTAAGTLRVIDLNPGSAGSDISGLVNMNGTLYFNANDGIHGLELWKSDGTAAGTSLVKDIAPGTNLTLNSSHSAPAGLTVFNGTLYFSAKTAAEGRELWKSDGTADGTVLIKDISPGTENSVLPSRFLELNGALYFVAGDATTGQELWKTDGTAEGTTVVRDIRQGSTGSGIQPPVIFNGELFFGADDGVHGYELWRSDGTTAGTTLVKDLFPGATSSNVSSFVVHEGRLYFGAWESSDVRSLWMSDGTAEGTVSLRDLAPELANRQTAPEASYNGQLFFRADSVSQGIELWVLTGQPEVVAPIGTVSIAATNASRLEGNSGTLGFTFTVTRTDSTRSASVNYAVTGSGSNPANAEDFGGALPSGKISFVAGETTKTITINVTGDTTVEPNEGFTVTLSNSVGTSLGAVSASGLIRNDDSSLSIAATSAANSEGNSGTTPFTFTVTRTGTISGAASVDYAVTGSGANAANAADFGGTLPSSTINFAALETSKTITINVGGDTAFEPNEGFVVTLSNSVGAGLGTSSASGTILNDDASDESFSIAQYFSGRTEGNVNDTPFRFAVNRTGNVTNASSVNYTVAGTGSNPANVADFGGTFPSGTINFAAGETEQALYVNVTADNTFESNETFKVTLSSSNGSTISGSPSTGTIYNDDLAPVSNAASTATFIVDTLVDESDGNFGVGDFSLREAIERANATVGTQTITFASSLTASGPATITLGGTQLVITSDVTIDGPGAGRLTIDADHRSRIFKIDDGAGTRSNVVISRLTLANGTATGSQGGAIDNRESLIIRLSTIRDSAASAGGGINSVGGDLTVVQSILSDNSASDRGGALHSVSGGVLTVLQSTINGNSASYFGGGIFLEQAGGTIDQSTLFDNVSTNYSAGIFVSLSETSVTQSTIAGNRGRGIFQSGGASLILKNTILVGNQFNDLLRDAGSELTISSTLIGNASGGDTLTNGVNGNIIGASASTVLGMTLTDLGGPTKVLPLLPGSLAINAGDDRSIPSDQFDADGDGDTTEPVQFDQRGTGFTRVTGSRVDMGAVEFGSTNIFALVNGDLANVRLDESGNLRLRDLTASGRVDRLAVSYDANTQEIVIRDPQNTLTSSIGTIVDAHEVRVPRAEITGNRLHVELNGGADQLDLSGLPADLLSVEVDGGDGNDTIIGHAGADLLSGELGHDSILGGAGNDTLLGGKGNDVLNGEDGDDSLCGQTQNDRLTGGDGDDTCDGGGGDDNLSGDAGNDRLLGTTGNDVISGGDGRDRIFGGDGHDILEGNSGNDQINGGSGDDTADGGAGNDFVEGQAGNDLLNGSNGDDTLDGGFDDDTLLGLAGNDHLDGGDGNDLARGGAGNDTLLGGIGNDNLSGSIGDDVEDGGEGADTLAGGDGNDSLSGGDGDDYLHGDNGLDDLYGNAGDDSLDGGAGLDVISGNFGNDILVGDEDDELL